MKAYELIRPDGTGSGVWACGECHRPHLVAQGLPADVNKKAADECCRPRRCHYCGKPTERDESGQFEYAHAECTSTPSSPRNYYSMKNPFARLLYQKMSSISEDCWAAVWLVDNEYTLWEILQGERQQYGAGQIDYEDVEELRVLSELANGWIWAGPDREFTPRLVSFDKWHSLITKRRTK